MKPVSGLKPPNESSSRSESARSESASFGRARASSASARASSPSAIRFTSVPPCGSIGPSVMSVPLLSSGAGGGSACAQSGRRRHALAGGSDVAARFEEGHDLLEALLDALLLRVDDDFGVQRFFVGVGDAGEVLDLAAEGLLIEALDVAPLQLLDAALGVDLDEVADESAVLVADIAVGRDRGRDDGDAVAGEEVGDEADAEDVGVAVLLAEAEAFAEVGADDVAVQDLDLVSA